MKRGLACFTFDDGISKNTELLLDILDAEKIVATFFIIGNTLNTETKKNLKHIHDRGHIIGNHTFTHPQITKISLEKLDEEIKKTSSVIKEVIDCPIKYFRPPYGAISTATRRHIIEMGLTPVLWDVDVRDWDLGNSPEEMFKDYLKTFVRPDLGSYRILQHDRRTASVKLVPAIAKLARDRGFKIASLDELYG